MRRGIRRLSQVHSPGAKAFTFADFVPTFLAFQEGRVKTWDDDRLKIEKHLTPAWGELPLRDITGAGATTGRPFVSSRLSRPLVDTRGCCLPCC